jgi:PIN domain nuclease of toxin-antitoxin system
VKYLVDTNAWLGFLDGRPDFSTRAKTAMIEQTAECVISIASIWEAAIKVGIGKLSLPYDLESDLPRILDENGFELLGIEFADATSVMGLERIHGDPFDRIQVIQARRRKLQVVSRDAVFDHFGLKRIW